LGTRPTPPSGKKRSTRDDLPANDPGLAFFRLHIDDGLYVIGGQESRCHQLLVLSDSLVGRPLNEQLTLVSH
jgi:hypothetical protein